MPEKPENFPSDSQYTFLWVPVTWIRGDLASLHTLITGFILTLLLEELRLVFSLNGWRPDYNL